MNFRSILCPVDFSAESRSALRHAAATAHRFGGRLTVMFVTDPLLDAASKQVYPSHGEFVNRTKTELAQFAEASLPGGPTRRPAVAYALATGNPAEQILRKAARLRSDLVVLGTHGSSGVRKLFFGSTTEQVLREASVPVLTIPPAGGGGRHGSALDVERVVVPLDLAGEWESDAVRADAIARAFDAELLLVHVLAPMTRLPWLRPSQTRIEQQRIDKAGRALDRVRTRLFGNRRSACAVVVGQAADEIARVAGRKRSLVVMSLRGTAGVWGARRGSIAYRVLTHGSTPVLALPRRRIGGRFAVRAAKAVGDILTERDRIEIAGIDALLSVASRGRNSSPRE